MILKMFKIINQFINFLEVSESQTRMGVIGQDPKSLAYSISLNSQDGLLSHLRDNVRSG